MPVFFYVYARTYARPCGLTFGHLCQFSSIMLAIWRYFGISYCLPVLLSIILRPMHVQQYAYLVLVVDHARCMVFDCGKHMQQYCIYSIIHLLYIVCSHFHNSQYSFETINDSSYAGSVSSTSISTEDSSEHEPDLYPASKSSKAILTLDFAKGVMYSSLAAKHGASRAQSTAVAIPRSPLLSVSLFSLLFYLFFCLLYFEFCLTWRAESEDVYQVSFICLRKSERI